VEREPDPAVSPRCFQGGLRIPLRLTKMTVRSARSSALGSMIRACVMGRFRLPARKSGNLRIAAGILVGIVLLVPFGIDGQSPSYEESAALQGFVRDSRGHPLAGASVRLQITGGMQTVTTQTDSDGSYRFPALSPGDYTLRAEMVGYDEASFGTLVLRSKEAKRIDLTLARQSSPRSSSSGTPESADFFDEPTFTVAGVTDPTNLGGMVPIPLCEVEKRWRRRPFH
jgi:hypothetical protein